jgi:protein gp37
VGPSEIEWTDKTWNPIAGCSVLSPGCSNCYAMRMAGRIQRMGGKGAEKYAGTTRDSKAGPVWTGKVNLDDSALLAPLRWRKPARIFVNSMSDLFHESVPDDLIDRVFAVMAARPQHTFQVLTKRAERMRGYLRGAEMRHTPDGNLHIAARVALIGTFLKHSDGRADIFDMVSAIDGQWPLPNVWLGVSVEDQRRADERIPLLLDTPASVRWISAEPLLEPVDLRHVAVTDTGYINSLTSSTGPNIDWVVSGGESGPGARPMHPDWIRSLRDQCAATGTAFFFKQWGSWCPLIDRDVDDPDSRRRYEEGPKSQIVNLAGGRGLHGERVHLMGRYGKRAAGAQLDGREHREWPR